MDLLRRITGQAKQAAEPPVIRATLGTRPAAPPQAVAPTPAAAPVAAPATAGKLVLPRAMQVAVEPSAPGGLVCAPFLIESRDAFEAHGLHFGLLTQPGIPSSMRFTVHDSLEAKIIPVALSGRENTCLILVHSEYREGPEIDEVAAELKRRGWKLNPEYQLVVVDPTLLAITARGAPATGRLRAPAGKESSDLFEMFRAIVTWGHVNGAADIDFKFNRRRERSQIGFSIGGMWVYPVRHEMPSDLMRKMLSSVFQRGSGHAESILDLNIEQALNIELELDDAARTNVVLRWASMAADVYYSVTVRIVEQGGEGAVSLEGLGYLPQQLETLNRTMVGDGGAIVFAGRVNSGKSTTLDALLSGLDPTVKIVTIEDPVEKIRFSRICNTVARPLTGQSSTVLRSKLMTLKRTGFNALYLGEIRDHETAMAAQDCFQSGQRLFTTVHAPSAREIPSRLAGVGIERSVLASPGNLRLLVYQALVPKTCTCAFHLSELSSGGGDRAPYWKQYSERLQRLFDSDVGLVRVRNPHGCPLCTDHGIPELYGFKGRTAVCEMLEPDEEFCELISRADSVGMVHYLRALRGDTRFDDPQMRGKSALDCAVYKMLLGDLDPHSVESRFESFSTIEEKQAQHRARVLGGKLRQVEIVANA